MKLKSLVESNSRYTEEAKKAFGDGAYAWAEEKYKEAKREKYLKGIQEMYKKIMDELRTENKMKLSEAVEPKPKKNDIVQLTTLEKKSYKIAQISRGVAYLDSDGGSRLPVMLSQLQFKGKQGKTATWLAKY